MVRFVIKAVKISLYYLEAVFFYLKRIGKKLVDEDVLFLASGLAFNGMLTMIPLLLLAASALGIFLDSSAAGVAQLTGVLDTIFPAQPFSTSIKDAIIRMIADIVEYRASLGLFGVFFLVYTATSLFDALRSVLHQIYKLPKTRSLLASFIRHVGFVFLAFLLFLVSSVSRWVVSILQSFVLNTPGSPILRIPVLDTTLPTVIATFLTGYMFYVVFRRIPDSKPPKTAAVISTLTTTTLWLITGKVFEYYLSEFSTIGTLYGPSTFLLVILIWVYISSLLFVFGAIIGQVYMERLRLREAGALRRWI